MKAARLVKRNQLDNQADKQPDKFDTEGQQQISSQRAARDAAKSPLNWVRESRELRQVNPRAQFAALFRSA
jgi:hypothetical protein